MNDQIFLVFFHWQVFCFANKLYITGSLPSCFPIHSYNLITYRGLFRLEILCDFSPQSAGYVILFIFKSFSILLYILSAGFLFLGIGLWFNAANIANLKHLLAGIPCRLKTTCFFNPNGRNILPGHGLIQWQPRHMCTFMLITHFEIKQLPFSGNHSVSVGCWRRQRNTMTNPHSVRFAHKRPWRLLN